MCQLQEKVLVKQQNKTCEEGKKYEEGEKRGGVIEREGWK